MFFAKKGHKTTALFCSEAARRRSIFKSPVQIWNRSGIPPFFYEYLARNIVRFNCILAIFVQIFSIFLTEKATVPFLPRTRDTLNSAEAREVAVCIDQAKLTASIRLFLACVSSISLARLSSRQQQRNLASQNVCGSQVQQMYLLKKHFTIDTCWVHFKTIPGNTDGENNTLTAMCLLVYVFCLFLWLSQFLVLVKSVILSSMCT